MVTERTVTCVNKNDYGVITHVGGGQTVLTRWRETVQETIQKLDRIQKSGVQVTFLNMGKGFL